MSCINCNIRVLSDKATYTVSPKDLVDVYLQLLNIDVTVDNKLTYKFSTIENNIRDLVSTDTSIIYTKVSNECLGTVSINNKYIPKDKSIFISSSVLDKIRLTLREYGIHISNSVLNTDIKILNAIYNIKVININTVVKDRLHIKHSMLCNIKEHILLISEDEELIIDESGNFYIEISEY